MDRSRKKRSKAAWKQVIMGIITIVVRFCVCILRGLWEGIKAFTHIMRLGLQNLATDLRSGDVETWSGLLFWVFILLLFFGSAV